MTGPRTTSDSRHVAALIALGAAPTGAALVRLAQVAGGTDALDAARFVADPLATAVHLVGVPVFVVGGALQLHAALRRRRPGLHRRLGRAVAIAGIGLAASGAWMTLTWDLPAHDQTTGLTLARLVVSAAMAGAFTQAVRHAHAGRWRDHRAWAIRGWALGMGAGTQALTHLPLLLAGQAIGDYDPDQRFLAMLAGWLVNAVLAEVVIRRFLPGSGRPRQRRDEPSTATTSPLPTGSPT